MSKEESLKLLQSIFLVCPHSKEEMTIDSIEGKKNVIIICSGDNSVWKFEIKIEEL